jgi:hypothetical protein
MSANPYRNKRIDMLTAEPASNPLTKERRSDAKELRIADLGFSNWETSWSQPSLSNCYFEVFLARPRGTAGAFSFLLKALRPQHCGAAYGPALIERERSLGSIDCRRLLPIVDHAYPKRISQTQATRGFLVTPCFQGRTLAKLLHKKEKLSSKTIEHIQSALNEIASAFRRHAWALERLAPEQILLSNEQGNYDAEVSNVMLVDYSTTFRFSNLSLFTEALDSGSSYNVSFDPKYILPPNAFYRDKLEARTSEKSIENFIRALA